VKAHGTTVPGVLRIELDVQPNDDGWFNLRCGETFGAVETFELGPSRLAIDWPFPRDRLNRTERDAGNPTPAEVRTLTGAGRQPA